MISVIIPVYNAEKFIQRAIKSAQLYEVGEIIVVDDKFPDNAIQIVKKIQQNDSRVSIIEHPDGNNHGASASRNLGIKTATCKYIAFLDADDYYLSNRFQKQLEFLEANPKYDGCYGKLDFKLDDDLIDRNPVNAKTTEIKKDIPPEDLLFCLITGKNGSIHVGDTMLFRREIFNHLDWFVENYELAQDIEFLYRAVYKFRFKNHPIGEAIAVRQVHNENRVTDKRKSIYYSRLLQKEGLRWLWSESLSNDQRRVIANAYFSSITNYHQYHYEQKTNSLVRIKKQYFKDISFFIKHNFNFPLFIPYLKWMKYFISFPINRKKK